MVTTRALLVGTALLSLSAPITAKDQIVIGANYFAADYLGGYAHLKPFHGSLALEADAIHVTDVYADYGRWKVKHERVTTIFVIPLATITAVTGSIEREDAHSAATLLLGWQHQEKSQDYVTITTETAESAEAFVFKVGPHESAGIVAKINFAVKQAKQATVTP
jgi:hypothetical protein